jgi:ABC-type antimicrobial peptide transport system permease subunit
MSETFFPISDLLRRKRQTTSIILTIAMSVASAVALLLFCEKAGLGFSLRESLLTRGLSAILSQFSIYVGVVVFALGAVVTSLVAFLMMTERTKDVGLMKAIGCPTGLVGGYLMTELLLTTVIGCAIGTVSGIVVDYAFSFIGGFEVLQRPANYWLCLLVFVVFFTLALVFGTQPILSAARLSPIKAISPINYFGTNVPKNAHTLSGRWLTWKVAYRTIVRRQPATLRIVALLSAVFFLLTLAIAGGTIASDTTVSWVETTIDENIVAVANAKMAEQYILLMAKFSGVVQEEDFDYLDEKLGVSNATLQQISSLPGVVIVESRLITYEQIRELRNFTIDPETLATVPVGDSRETKSIIIGIDQFAGGAKWSLRGRMLDLNDSSEAIIGDSIAHIMYSPIPAKRIVFSDPLVQGVEIRGKAFQIVGVCVDPIDNGHVVYLPIQKLKEMTNTDRPNIVFVQIDQSADMNSTIELLRGKLSAIDSNLGVVRPADLNGKNAEFLQATWSRVMVLPFFALVGATLCLIGYMTTAIEEQKQEFAVMRAIGGKPKLVTRILAFQSSTLLFSGFGIGISLGTVVTISVLMPNPVVTSGAILKIAAWLLSALVGMFVFTLPPARSIAKSSILRGLV